jgi:integrase
MPKPEKRIQNGQVRWYARYRDPTGKQRSKTFDRKVDADAFLQDSYAAMWKGAYITPEAAHTTVAEWCATWLEGYGSRRISTVRQAEVHLARIVAAFGTMQLAAVRPSHVKAWTALLRAEGLADSYVYALHARLAQLMSDAVHDGILLRSPCSRRTSPPAGKQRAYVATTAQVWALHDAMPDHLRAAVLVGAFAGLRVGETCGLRVADINFMRGVITPAVQYPAEPLKNEISETAIPIPQALAAELSAHVARWPAETLLTDRWGHQLGPWTLERAFRVACDKVPDLPVGFRYHDLRHYLASLLIADGADVKVVQARMRHASSKTTFDTYAHLWPDKDDSTRATISAVMAARADEQQAL